MGFALTLPRLVFGPGTLAELAGELTMLGVARPLLISDRGLERAGVVATVTGTFPGFAAQFLDVPENPTAAGADQAAAAYHAGHCDGIVALGGGSVIDTAKLVAALVLTDLPQAAALIGRPDRMVRGVAPLVVIPTTLGTGSESSPVSALHITADGPPLGTRSSLLVPRLALCDPDLTRSLPPRLIAATGIDALSHCLEGYFAEPPHPVIDALALDGIARVCADIAAAVTPAGDAARLSLMAAAYQGGVAIHKGLGPAHAVALSCGNQHVHHGTLVAVALPHTTRLLARHLPAKAIRVAAAMGLTMGEGADTAAAIADALTRLIASLGLPVTLTASGYTAGDIETLVADLVASPFNRTSPYAPDASEYRALVDAILA